MPTKTEPLPPFKGYIFDIDGTMINSMKVHLKAWQETLKKHGINKSLKEVGEQAYGINPEIVRRFFGENISEADIKKISDEKEELFRSQFDPEEDVIKGFIEFVANLKKRNIPVVIGSAAPSDNIDFFLDRLGIHQYFRGIVQEEDVTKGKPSPQVFIKAAKLIEIPISECVVFEDSPSGAEASAKAGSHTVAVLSTKSREDFKDIPGIVRFIKDYTDLEMPPIVVNS